MIREIAAKGPERIKGKTDPFIKGFILSYGEAERGIIASSRSGNQPLCLREQEEDPICAKRWLSASDY